MKKMLFVYNPHSGKGEIGRYLSEMLVNFTAGGFDVTVHPTNAPLDGQNYILQNADEYDLVVSSGGDGMLHELVNAAIRLGSGHYGYVPGGTVNDYAASLNIPKDMPKAAEVITKENFVKVDAGIFNSEYFSYVAAFGLFTDVSYTTDQKAKNAIGALAYFLNALRSIEISRFMEASSRVIIEANGEKIEDDFIFGLCGNTYSVGGMKNIIPENADMHDGLLDGIFVRTPKNIGELDLIRRALLNRQTDCDNVIFIKSDKFIITSENELAWTLDGEDGGKTTKAEISVFHNAYEIAVPLE